MVATRGAPASTWLAYAIAALAPVVVGAALWSWSSPDDELDHAAAAMDRRLRAARPDVVVLGSSIALRDVDRDRLAERLGLDPARVMKATVPASVGAHWYTVLKYRVLSGRDHPKVVLIADALASLLTPDVEGHDARLRLADHLTHEDAVLAARTFTDGGGVADERRRLELRELRRSWVSAVPDAVIGLLRAGAARAGRQLVLDVTDRVFALDNLEQGQHGGLPEMFRPPEPERAWRIPETPDQSYLPDLLRLCADAGSHLLFVRMPFPPSFPDADRLPPWVEHDAAAFLEERGGSYAELRSLGLDDAAFSDREHATAEASLTLTDRIASVIVDRGLLGPGRAAPGWVPPLTRVRVDDVDVPREQALTGLDLHAGQRVQLSADAAWTGPVRLSAVATTEAPASFEISWGGQTQAVRGEGRLTAALDGGASAVEITVTSGQVHLASVAMGAPGAMAWLVGDDVTARSGSLRLVGGRRADHHVVPVFSAPPFTPDDAPRIQRGPRGTGRFVVPALEPLADAKADSELLTRADEGALLGTDFVADACSPLIVLEDGAPLAWPHTFCDLVPTLRGGRMCHVGGAVQLSASDGTDPVDNGRRYTLALDPGRLCAVKARPGTAPLYDAVWLYPGDEVTLTAADGASRLPFGARTLALVAQRRMGDGDLELVVGGAATSVSEAQAEAGFVYTAPEPVAADTPVVVRNRGQGWWLLTRLVWGEG